MLIVRVIFLLLDDFDFFGVVLRVRVAEEGAISSFSKPVRAGPKLIREVGIVIC